MFTLRRWWDRHRIQIMLVSVALGSAVFLRQTQGALLFDVYQLVTRPFQGSPDRQTVLANAQMQELQNRLTELENQNQRLQALLGYAAKAPKSGIAAPVVGRSADHWWQHILLGRGGRDGIKENDVVMAPGGLVGRVTSVTATSSRVLLLSDPSSKVGVMISRTRYMGSLRGKSSNQAVMEFYDKVPDVRPGDVVSTSSLSTLYPAGLPIGRVESVNMSRSPAPEAIISLTAPVAFLEWAVVYPPSQAPQPLPSTPSPAASASPAAPSEQP